MIKFTKTNRVKATPYYDPRLFYVDKDGNIRSKATGELVALVARKVKR